jgi:hypothetical protein
MLDSDFITTEYLYESKKVISLNEFLSKADPATLSKAMSLSEDIFTGDLHMFFKQWKAVGIPDATVEEWVTSELQDAQSGVESCNVFIGVSADDIISRLSFTQEDVDFVFNNFVAVSHESLTSALKLVSADLTTGQQIRAYLAFVIAIDESFVKRGLDLKDWFSEIEVCDLPMCNLLA